MSSVDGFPLDLPVFEFENQFEEGSKLLRRYNGKVMMKEDMMEANFLDVNKDCVGLENMADLVEGCTGFHAGVDIRYNNNMGRGAMKENMLNIDYVLGLRAMVNGPIRMEQTSMCLKGVEVGLVDINGPEDIRSVEVNSKGPTNNVDFSMGSVGDNLSPSGEDICIPNTFGSIDCRVFSEQMKGVAGVQGVVNAQVDEGLVKGSKEYNHTTGGVEARVEDDVAEGVKKHRVKRKVSMQKKKGATILSVGKIGKKPEVSMSENQHEVTDISISDNDIKWRNWLICNSKVEDIAKEVWEFGRSLGMVEKGDAKKVIEHLSQLESRDREASGGQCEKQVAKEN